MSPKEPSTRTQYFLVGRDIPGEWWTLFHSRQLNKLIIQGIQNSPNLIAAKAALSQANYIMTAKIGATLLPALNVGVGAERQLTGSENTLSDTPGSIFNLFNATIAVSYTPDVFGGNRREIESLTAQVDFQRYELIAAYLTLTSNIVTTAITIASLEEQIKATLSLINEEEKQLAIIKAQFHLGGASKANVLSQESLVAQTKATLPPLQTSLVQSHHALAVLVGHFPSEQPTPYFDLNQMTLPNQLPVSIPSRLVQQRPDILAAEATLHSASAQIGVAKANYFPQVTLGANSGRASLVASDIFTNPASYFWNYSAQLTQSVFNGGALVNTVKANTEAFKQAAAQYQQTVLQAFQNVADVLRALEDDARTLKAQQQAVKAAKGSLVLTEKQYRLGGTSFLSLLTAQQQYQQALISFIQAEAARYSDTAALFQAVGGGWWNPQPTQALAGVKS